MRFMIKDCNYELVKDILMSQNSKVKKVEKDSLGTIVTLEQGFNDLDLRHLLNQEPLRTFTEGSEIYGL